MTVTWLKDSQRKKVYQAENDIGLDVGLISPKDFVKFTKGLFRILPHGFPTMKVPTVYSGAVRSNTAALAWPAYADWKIVFDPSQSYTLHATHEAAHLISHRYCELNDKPWEPHGGIFTSVHIFLIWKHVDKQAAIRLRRSYQSHGVKISPFRDL